MSQYHQCDDILAMMMACYDCVSVELIIPLKTSEKHKVNELTGCRCGEKKAPRKKNPSGYKPACWQTIVCNLGCRMCVPHRQQSYCTL